MRSSLRVTGGEARGRSVRSLAGLAIRPTPAAVRKSLFDILGPRLEGASCLDLFAGTGLLGIEALSRGAASATFVEREEGHCRLIRENLERLGYADRAKVLCGEVARWLGRGGLPGAPFDLVLLDPPYAGEEGVQTLTALGAGKLLHSGGWVVLEHARGTSLPEETGRLRRVREAGRGETRLGFYACNPARAAGERRPL